MPSSTADKPEKHTWVAALNFMNAQHILTALSCIGTSRSFRRNVQYPLALHCLGKLTFVWIRTFVIFLFSASSGESCIFLFVKGCEQACHSRSNTSSACRDERGSEWERKWVIQSLVSTTLPKQQFSAAEWFSEVEIVSRDGHGRLDRFTIMPAGW